jgi:cellulose synthase/poly-beta-1,6-N-acetylglucosamine synthase-like glycosyltransferase
VLTKHSTFFPLYPALLILCSLVFVQVTYLLIFIIGLSKKKVTTDGGRLPVSVIVCAHDEVENLKELIPQLLSQDHPEFEVIIVDDRSNDSTFDFLLEATAKDHRLRMVHINRTPPHTNSKKYALTLGIKAARFEWLLLTDADCRPDGTSWISTMSRQFNDATQFVLGYSPYEKGKGFLNAFIRFDTLMTAIQYVSFALLGNPYMGVGRNLAYRRSRFLEVKGFNNIIAITGGDDDLFVNLHAKGRNTAVCVERASQTHSKPKTSLKNFIQQRVRHLSVGRHYRFGHRLLLGLFMISWLGVWFLGLPLMLKGDYYIAGIAGGLIIFRIILVIITVHLAAKRFGQQFELWLVPLLDFIYAFYYLVTGLRTLVTKKVRWKN